MIGVFTPERLYLFQARKPIVVHWKSVDSPTVREWVKNIGEQLRLEKRIYQHWGNAYKFERIWAPVLDVPGLARWI